MKQLLLLLPVVCLCSCKKEVAKTATGNTSVAAAPAIVPADFAAKGKTYVYGPVTFEPNQLGSAIEWDLGDGTISNAAKPVHKYSKEGVYKVRLTINGENTITKELRITPWQDQLRQKRNWRVQEFFNYCGRHPGKVSTASFALQVSSDSTVMLPPYDQDFSNAIEVKYNTVGTSQILFSSNYHDSREYTTLRYYLDGDSIEISRNDDQHSGVDYHSIP